MSRKALLAIPAAAVAAAIGVGVIGSPVDSADAARPFAVSKSQFKTVKKNASTALSKSKQNAKAIAELSESGIAGPQGPQGAPGGFDPAKVARVVGPSVPLTGAQGYVSYTLPCPAGTIALAGGWSAPTAVSKTIRVPASFPTATLSGWSYRFAYSAAAASATSVTPYVVCAGK